MPAGGVEPNLDVPDESVKENAASSPAWLKRLGWIVLNLWLCYHLFAIVIGPASVAPAPPVVQSAWKFAAGYLQLLYLNHGFHFFTPEPAGSALVRCELGFPDGTTRTVQQPNRTIWPRLLYHRHFMLTEFLGNGPEEFRPLIERAMARNLCRTTGAVQAKLFLVYHDTTSVDDILAGRSLNEPGSFTETALGSYLATELSEPYQPAILAPEPPAMATRPATKPWEFKAPASDAVEVVSTPEAIEDPSDVSVNDQDENESLIELKTR